MTEDPWNKVVDAYAIYLYGGKYPDFDEDQIQQSWDANFAIVRDAFRAKARRQLQSVGLP